MVQAAAPTLKERVEEPMEFAMCERAAPAPDAVEKQPSASVGKEAMQQEPSGN